MSASRLREAATRLREVAEAATPGPWVAVDRTGNDLDILAKQRGDKGGEQGSAIHHGDPSNSTWGSLWPSRNASADAAYIALMAPPVALALADWLDSVHDAMVPDPGRSIITIDEQHAFKIVDTILGPTS